MSAWRRLFLVPLCLVLFAPLARASGGVPLLNGSVISSNGLQMTVSGCAMILAGVTQSSCAAGHIVLQTLSSGSSVGFSLAGDGTGANGANVLSAVSVSGLTQLSFTVSVLASGHKTFSQAATTIHGTVPSGSDLLNVSTSQIFSAAAGGGALNLIPWYSVTSSLSLTPTGTFSIANTLALNTSNAYAYGTFQLSSFQTAFTPAPEPASLAVLVTGIAGLVFARWRRSKAKPQPAGGDMG